MDCHHSQLCSCYHYIFLQDHVVGENEAPLSEVSIQDDNLTTALSGLKIVQMSQEALQSPELVEEPQVTESSIPVDECSLPTPKVSSVVEEKNRHMEEVSLPYFSDSDEIVLKI